MKVGDLICYNSAGMKKKTMGMVLEISGEHGSYHNVLVWWLAVGTWMPRRSWHMPGAFTTDYRMPIYVGEKSWHECGDWFEVINEEV